MANLTDTKIFGNLQVSRDINNIRITPSSSTATLTILGGKTLTINNTITLSGTDSSTLNIGGGGTLGTGAFNPAYVLTTATASVLGGVKTGTGITNSSGTISVAYGTTAGTACQGNDSRLSNARTPVAHVHGNITNTGYIGTTANVPIITGTGGILQAGSFGTAANTFCQGNDSRLSNARTPVAHVLDSASHTVSGLTTGHFLKATGATTFGFAAHGLTYTDVGAAPTVHGHSYADSSSDGGAASSVANALTVGAGLQLSSGTTYNGSAGLTISISSAVATLTGTQTLTNKTINGLSLNNSTASWTISGGSTTVKTLTVTESATIAHSTHASGSDNQTITSGAGMNFTSGNGNITITLGTPSDVNGTSDNSVSGTTHTHKFTLPSHTHGNITNDGKIIGSTANYLVMTGTGGSLTTLTTGANGTFLKSDNGTPSWVANPAINVRNVVEWTAISGQTTFVFTGGYNAQTSLDVFLNGVLLSAPDYTATTSPNVVLSTGAREGDLVKIVGYTNSSYLADLTFSPTAVVVSAEESTAENRYPVFVGPNQTGTMGLKSDTGYIYKPSDNSLTAGRFVSTVASGTAPLTVASTTLVTNLNADLLEGKHGTTTADVNSVALRDGSGGLTMYNGNVTATTGSTSTTTGAFKISGGLGVAGNIYGAKVYGAVWNDIADFLEVPDDTKIEFGKAYTRSKDKVVQTYRKNQKVIGISSDTYGFGVGKKNKGTELPIAIGGWVLAHVDKVYKFGTELVATKDGRLTKASLLTRIFCSNRVLATFDKQEVNKEWNGVEVKGRHWVKVK